MNPVHQIADPCPNCGKPDAARMGSSAWLHSYSCCSELCGRAFYESAEHIRREIMRIKGDIHWKRQELKLWQSKKQRVGAKESR
jgi:hypothetical protein